MTNFHLFSFLFAFLNIELVWAQICLSTSILHFFYSYNFYKVPTQCQECPSGSFYKYGLGPDLIDPTIDCQPILSTSYSKVIYILQGVICPSSHQCYNSLLEGLISIHNDDLAGQYIDQEIQIYFLGTPHFLLNSSLLFQGTRFFRRMNASVLISPRFCEDENISGCFLKANNEKVDLIFKTFGFLFEINKNFTMMNVNMLGYDIILNSSNTNPCYSSSMIYCCSDNLMDLNFSSEECGLINRPISLVDKLSLTYLRGLFQLRLMYNSTLPDSDISTPTLNLINVTISEFYSMDVMTGWMALIVFNTLGYAINIQNLELSANFFAYGFFYFSILEEDPYYKLIPSSEISNIYAIYCFSNIFQNFFHIEGLIISDYNTYSAQIANASTGEFAPGLMNFFTDQNLNQNYSFTNLTIGNVTLLNPFYVFWFSNSLILQSNIIFNDIVITNSTISNLLTIEQNTIYFNNFQANCVSIFKSQFWLIASNNASLNFNNSILKNVHFNGFSPSMTPNLFFITNGFLSIQNTFFQLNTQGIIYMTNGFLIFFNCSLHDLYLDSAYLFSLYSSNCSFNEMESINLTFYSNYILYSQASYILSNYLNITNTIWRNVSVYYNGGNFYFFNLVSNSANPNFFVQNLSVGNLFQKNITTRYFFFLLQGNPYNEVFISGIIIFPCFTLTLFCSNLAAFVQIILENIYFMGSINGKYYLISIFNMIAKIINSSIYLRNILVTNFELITKYHILGFKSCDYLFVQNVSFFNISDGITGGSNPYPSLLYQYNIVNVFYSNAVLINTPNIYNILQFSQHTNIMVEKSYFVGVFYDSMTPPIARAIYLQDADNITISDCFFSNLSTFPSGDNYNQFLGIIGLIPTAGGTPNSSYFNATFLNNRFIFCSAEQDGIISIYGYINVYLFNTTFENTWGFQATIALYQVDNLTLQKTLGINLTSSQEGGILYAINSYQIMISEGYFANLSSLSGGVIFCLSSGTISLIEIFVINSTCISDGGSFFFDSLIEVFIEKVTIINSSSVDGRGGALYQSFGELIINNLIVEQARCSGYGGGIMISGNFQSDLQINNSSFINCSSEISAGTFYMKNIKTISILDTIIGFSTGEQTITIDDVFSESFDENNVNYPSVLIQRISCLNNEGRFNCFYFSSEDKLVFQDVLISQSTGSSLFIESPLMMPFSIVLLNITIYNCNFQISSEELIKMIGQDALITVQQTLFEISMLNCSENYNEGNLIDILSNQVFFQNSILKGFYTKGNGFFYFINVQFANLSISNLKMETSVLSNGILNIFSSNLNLNGFVISMVTMLEPLAINIENSQMILINSSFFNCTSSDSILNFVNSNLTIIDSQFVEANSSNNLSYSVDSSSILIFQDDQLQKTSFLEISNSTFVHFDKNAITIQDALKFTLNFSSFVSTFQQNLNDQQFSRAIYIDNISETWIFSSNFSSFRSPNGAALLMIQSAASQYFNNFITIVDCVFKENQGFLGAAVFLHGLLQFRLYGCQFFNNSAGNISSEESGKGGCVLSECEYFMNSSFEATNCWFQDNWADNMGSCLIVKNGEASNVNQSNIFINNRDQMNFSDSVASLPINYYLLGESFSPEINFSFTNLTSNMEKTQQLILNYEVKQLVIPSGQYFNFSILLTDNYNQSLLFENEALGVLKCNQTNFSIEIPIDRSSTTAQQGILFFTNVQIVFIPNTTLQCVATITYNDEILVQSVLELGQPNLAVRSLMISIPAYIRNCVKGEILMPDHSCRECQVNTYSLEDPMIQNANLNCINCPSNAICLGGDSIFPLPGYWRQNENSSLILTCPTEEACLGYDMNNLTQQEKLSGRCHPNYLGNLCYLCKSGLARENDISNCEECKGMIWTYIKFALGIIFILSYCYVQIQTYGQINKNDPSLAILLKSILNHFQIISMVNLIPLGWTTDFNIFLGIQEYLSFMFQDFFNIDCIVSHINEDLLVQRAIFTILLPVMFALLMMMVFLLASFILNYSKTQKKQLFFIQKMRVAFLTLFFIFYPEILIKTFMLLNCLVINDNTNLKVLKFSPNVQCWEYPQTNWALSIAFPGLIIWGIGTPLLILFFLWKYRQRIQKTINSIDLTEKEGKPTIHKKIDIMIDEDLRTRFFGKQNIEFPTTKNFTYQNENFVLSESWDISTNYKENILKELQSYSPAADLSKNVNTLLFDDAINENRAIESLEEFQAFLNLFGILLDEIDEKTIDLKKNLILLRIQFEQESYDYRKKISKRKSIFSKSQRLESKQNEQKENIAIFESMGFLYKGYKEDYFYWEILLFSRKFLIVMIGGLSETLPSQTNDIALFFVLSCYWLFQFHNEPFLFSFLNTLEMRSLNICIISTFIGMMMYSEILRKITVLFLIIVIGLNAGYILYWLYCVKKYGKTGVKLKNLLRKITKKKGKKSK